MYLNQFASDRAGLSLHAISPVRDADLVLGKAAGGAAIYAVSVAICVVCAALAGRGGLACLRARHLQKCALFIKNISILLS